MKPKIEPTTVIIASGIFPVKLFLSLSNAKYWTKNRQSIKKNVIFNNENKILYNFKRSK